MPLFSLRPHVFDEIILSTSLYIYSPFLCCVCVCYLINTLFSRVRYSLESGLLTLVPHSILVNKMDGENHFIWT